MSVKHNGKTIASNPKFHPDLLEFKWSDHLLNDPQWLRADTFSQQYKSVYGPAYDHLADDIVGKTLQSETVAGTTVQFYLADDKHKICPASEESNVAAIYAATGVAWYYIIDTTNQWFKLPRAKHNKYAATLGVVGNGTTIGITNGTSNAGLYCATNTTDVQVGKNMYGQPVGYSASGTNITELASFGITTDPTKSGIIAQQDQDTDEYKYLYFYVGQFTQTALENTAGINTEIVNDFSAHRIIDFQEPTAANNYTWYRLYADGWVEQGGFCSGTAGVYTVNLPVEMADENYSTIGTYINPNGVNNTTVYSVRFFVRNTNSFTCDLIYYNGHGQNRTNEQFNWQVSGMAA